MGNRRHLREAFFKAHPVCCFCGGAAPAVQEDHIPARALFRGRQWPEGYAFPACADCNRGSAEDELAMAWLVRIRIRDYDAEAEREMATALTQLHDRRPEWVEGIKEMSRVEVRQHLRKGGLSLQSFGKTEIGMVTMPVELREVPDRYAIKLGKALHYSHTGRIVPVAGVISAWIYPNASFMSQKFPLELFAPLQGIPAISRAKKQLGDQFSYRYAITSDRPASAFLVQFGESMAMAIFVFEDEAAYLARRAELGLANEEGRQA